MDRARNRASQGAVKQPDVAFDKLVDDVVAPFESATLAMVLADARLPDVPVISVNAAFEGLTGYSAAEALGRNCRFLSGAESDPVQLRRLARAVEQGEPCRAVVWNRRRDGSPFLNEVIITPVRDHSGRLCLFKGLLREVDSTGREPGNRVRFALAPDRSVRVLPCARGEAPGWMQALHLRDRVRLAHSAAFVAGRGQDTLRLVIKLEFDQPGGASQTRELTANMRFSGGGEVVFEGFLRDTAPVTDSEARLRLLETVAAHANDGILITEAEPFEGAGPCIVYVNAAVLRHTGYAAEELVGKTPRVLQGPGTDRGELDRVNAALRAWQPVTTQLLNYRKDGSTFWAELNITPVADAYGWWTHWVAVQRDVTERRAATDRIEFLALHDPLTGLANRRLATTKLEVALLDVPAEGRGCGAIRLDLDRFKSINDTFGHAAGDGVLVETGRRLQAYSRAGDLVARIGGDEFLVIMPRLEGCAALATAAERVREAVTGPFTWEGHPMHILTSVGAALYPHDADTIEGLLAAADLSLYRSKEQGRGRANVFCASLREQATLRKQLGEALRIGLERNEFEPFFQPQLRVSDRSLVGLEALIRWRHPDRGVLAPAAFLELAEDAGLMPELDDRMAERAIAAAAAWGRAGLPCGVLAINLSGESFANPNLADKLAARLAAHGLAPQRFAVEMVERAFIGGHASEVAAKLAKLRQLGIGVDLDDFGTGYASLTHLRLFQVDRIKLDSSFVDGIGEDPDDDIIVTAIVRLAKSLGLRCVAEGVENQRQLAFLQALGCDDVQGYLFAKPMDQQRMTTWLKLHAARTPGASADLAASP
jgi:diguanylate cyclase (GGDEF)-like protein/PAS domain S-box-containing protein